METEAQVVSVTDRRPAFSWKKEGENSLDGPSPDKANPSSPTPQGNLWAS